MYESSTLFQFFSLCFILSITKQWKKKTPRLNRIESNESFEMYVWLYFFSLIVLWNERWWSHCQSNWYVPKCHSAFWVHTANSFNCRTFHENDNSLTLCKSPSQTLFVYRNGCILNFCQQLNAKQRNEYASIIAYRMCKMQ